MTNVFTHYSSGHSEHGHKDMENCGACVLLYSGKEGPNYAAWPLAFIENGRRIPSKYIGALRLELRRTDNMPYLNNLKDKLWAAGYNVDELLTDYDAETLKRAGWTV